MDTSDSLINPTAAVAASNQAIMKMKLKQPLHNRIKGGGKANNHSSNFSQNKHKLIADIQSWDDVNSLNDYSLDSSVLYSSTTATTTISSSSSSCCPPSSTSSELICNSSENYAEIEAAQGGLIIPNKEYEYSKMLRMFLGNKNMLSHLRDEHVVRGKSMESPSEERLIYSYSKNPTTPTLSPMKFALSSSTSTSDNTNLNGLDNNYINYINLQKF